MMSCSSATFLFSPKICLALIAIQTQNDHKRYVYSGWKMYRWWCKRLTMDKWRQTKKVVITKFIAFEFVCLFFVASLFWLWLNNMNDYEIRSIYLIYNCTQMCWHCCFFFFCSSKKNRFECAKIVAIGDGENDDDDFSHGIKAPIVSMSRV